ncbi:hypothetical protein Terro_0020 [Terriglobus roseus DSM 18391]|uniref:Uncharacterized protein n=1 Tax=Terriglobus roseus (strain DSM 18391 / NRRL B-41598 / KBS 63) TaxID=926566 RepID=I3ZAV4_TERRK|nr:hypothetical protein Terro_0020 [Terriglobus roseus DSM 18391]
MKFLRPKRSEMVTISHTKGAEALTGLGIPVMRKSQPERNVPLPQ